MAVALRVGQSICVRASARFQQPELKSKDVEHLAEDLDKAELRAFDDRLGPDKQAAQLALPELDNMQSQLPHSNCDSQEAQPAGGLEAGQG